MKHIKPYKIYESRFGPNNESNAQLLDHIRDILSEIKDDAYSVYVNMFNKHTCIMVSISNMRYEYGGYEEDIVSMSKYIEDILHLVEYMKTTEFKFGKIIFDISSEYSSNIEEYLDDISDSELSSLIKTVDNQKSVENLQIIFSNKKIRLY